MAAIRPVGPGSTEGAGLVALLDEMRTAILQLQTPQGPVPLAGVLEADLPASADHEPGSVLYVSDLQKVAVNNGTTWTDTDGGAL